MPENQNNLNLAGLSDWNFDVNKGLENLQEEQTNQHPYVQKQSLPNIPQEHVGEGDRKLSKIDAYDQSLQQASQKLPTSVPATSFIANKERYPKQFPGQTAVELEEQYGQSQSGLEKAAYAIPRAVGTFSKTLLQGITAPIVGIGYSLFGGPEQGFIQNDYNRWLESWNDTFDKVFPLYETSAERNASFLGQIRYGNSWVHMLEFLAMGAGLATTGYLTGDLGEAMGGAAITRGISNSYMNAVTKLAEIAPEISELENGQAVTSELVSRINKIATSSIGEGDKMEAMTATIKDIGDKYLKKASVWNATKQKVYGAASLMGMNAGMAAKATTDFEKNLTDQYITKHGVEPTDDEKAKIKEMANQVGQWTFGVGTMLSSISLGGLFKGVLAKNDADEYLINKISGLTEKASEKEGKLGITSYAQKGLPFEGASTKVGKFMQWSGNKGYQVGKFASKLVDPWAGLSLAEFSMLGPSVENYYNKKYEQGTASVIDDAIGPNAKKLFTTKEGWSTFFTGMLGTAPEEAGRKFKEDKTLNVNTGEAIKAFNDLSKSAHNYLIDESEAIARGKSLQNDYVEATENNDNLAKYNIRQAKLLNYLFPRLKYGRKDLVVKDMENYKTIASTDEGIQKLQAEGILPKEGDPKTLRDNFNKYLDNIIETTNNMETYYKTNMMRYGNITDKEGKRIFDDDHIEKMMYLSGMTDDATRRIKQLANELITDKNLQDKFLHRTEGTEWKGGYETMEPTTDIAKLMTAESRSTVVSKEGEKSYLAGDLYEAIKNRINNLEVVQTTKDELNEKLDDLVQLNFLRKNYLKQYNDILRDPKRYKEEVPNTLLNPYTEDYVGKEDVLDMTRLRDSLYNNIELDTKYGKKAITIGEEYYAGSPIVLKVNGTEEGFRKFRVVKELPEEGDKILIKTENGTLIPVEKDFLKKHDVGRTRNISKTSTAKFYDKNKRKRLIRKTPTKKLTTEDLEKQKADLLLEKDRNIKNLTTTHEETIREKNRQIDALEKQKQLTSSVNATQQLDTEIQALKNDITNLPTSSRDEAAKITAFYNKKIKDLEDLAEKQKDPKKFLDTNAKKAYVTELQKIEDKYNNEVREVTAKKEQNPNLDLDFEKSKIQDRKDKAIEELKSKFRTAYDKRLKELTEGQEEMGSLEYSPSTGQLHFVNTKNESTDINPSDFKDIKKADGSSWDAEDKEFFEKSGKLIEEEKQLENLQKQTPVIETLLNDADNRNYTEPSKVFYEELDDNTKQQKEKEANTAIEKVTKKPTGAKKPINIAVRSSIVLDTKYLLDKYPALRPWLERRNSWAERFNTFATRILEPFKTNFWKTSDLKDGNGNYKQPSVIFVHPGNQKELGLDNLILQTDVAYQKNKQLPDPIYMVFVHTDEQGKKWTIDNQGKKLQEIGKAHTEDNYNNMIFTARPSNLEWENGVPGYQDASPEDVKKYKELFDKETKSILESTADKPIINDFKVSNGQIKTPTGAKRKTSISQTGLVDEDLISYPMVQIGTTGAGITIGEKKVETPAGIPYFVRGTSVHILDSKKFTESNKNHIWSCLHWMAETFGLSDAPENQERKSFKSTVNDYLASIVFLNHKFIQKESATEVDKKTAIYNSEGFPTNRYENQISIAYRRTNNDSDNLPYLMLGKDTRILFTPKSLEENKQVIKDFLDKTHHIVLNKHLLAEAEKQNSGRGDIKFSEIIGFDEKGIPETLTWDSYTKYLTSSKDVTGRDRKPEEIPLTLNVDKPVEGKLPVEGMYVTTYKNPNEKLELQPKPKEEVKPEPTKQEQSVEANLPLKFQFGEDEPIDLQIKLDGSDNILKTKQKVFGDVTFSATLIDGKPDVHIKKVLDIDEAVLETDPAMASAMKDRFDQLKSYIEKKITDQLSKPEVKPEPKVEQKTIDQLRQEVIDGKPITEFTKEEQELLNTPLKSENPVTNNTEANNVAESIIKRRKKKSTTSESTDIEAKRGDIEKRKAENLATGAVEQFHNGKSIGWLARYDKIENNKKKSIVHEDKDGKTIKHPTEQSAKQWIEEQYSKELSSLENTKSGISDTKNMIVSELQKGIPLENIPEFVNWMKENLPQFKTRDLPYAIRNGKGGYSFGQYEPAYRTILLGIDAIEGTGFHEAFHAVWDSFLSPEEQRNLISEFRNRVGSYTNRFGETKDYSSPHTENDIIEQLADEFREHNLSNKIYEKAPEKMSFFKRLKNFLKHFFGIDKVKTLSQLFDKINAGYYKDASFYNRKVPTRDMIRFPDGSKITQQTVRDFSNGVLNIINQYLSEEKGGLSWITEGKIGIDEVLDNVKNQINKQINEPDERFTDDQVREFAKIIQPLCDVLTDDEGSYFQLNDKKWEYLVINKLKDRVKSAGLKTIRTEEGINTEHIDNESETSNSSVEGESKGPDEHEEVSNETERSPFGTDMFKINAKETSPKEIQFVFNTLVDVINESVPGYNKDLENPITKTNSILFNKLVEDNSLFYKTMANLSYSSTIDEMDERFKELAKKVPALVAPYKYFFGIDAASRTPEHWKILTRFFKTFSKYNPENVMQRKDESGKSYVTSSNADTIVNIMTKKWESNFKGDAKVSTYDAETKSYKLNPKFVFTKTKDTNSRFAFLKEIGFTGITKEKYESFVKDNKDSALEQKFSNAVDKIYEGVIKYQKNGTAVLGKDIFETGKSINKLAEIAADMSVDKSASQFQRLDREFVQTHVNQNVYARIIGKIRGAKNLLDFLNNNKENGLSQDVGVKNSVLIGHQVQSGTKESQFFKKDGTPKKINLIVDNGNVDEHGNRTLLRDMTNIQRVVYALNGLLRGREEGTGIFQMFAPADQNTDFGLEMDYYISIKEFKSTDKAYGKEAKFQSIMRGYLEDEIAMIRDAENRMHYEELAKEVNGTPRAKQLRYFKDLLSENTVKKITDYANKEGEFVGTNLSFDEFMKTKVNIGTTEKPVWAELNLVVRNEVRANLNKEVKAFVDLMFREGAITNVEKKGIVYYKFPGINTDFLKEYGINRFKVEGEQEDYYYSEHGLNNIVEFATMNYKIHNIELSKLFYGDPANYKDFLKRAKMYNSGTELNFYSEEYNTMANEKFNVAKFGDKEVKLQPGDPGYTKFTHNIKGLTYNHGEKKTGTNVVSKSIEFIKKYLPNAKDYETSNNEIDAQSHMSLNAARQLKKKQGTWTDKHEELYQYQTALKRLNRQERLEKGEKGLREKLFTDPKRTNYYHSDTNKLGELSKRGKELKALDEEIVKNPPVGRDYIGLFNVEKPLGAGFASNEKFLTPNGLKTSTMPLVSSSEGFGSALDELDMFMEKHGIDYTGPQSQQKFGRIAANFNLYNVKQAKDFNDIGKIALHSYSPEEVNDGSYYQPYANFNKIVETATRHDEGTIGTQLRVQSTLDMLDSGLPRDFYDSGEHSFADQKTKWDAMSEAEKKSSSELYKLYSEMNDTLKGMITQAKPVVYSQLGIGEVDGKLRLKNPERLLSYLQEMMNTYNIPANLRDSIKITYDANGYETIRLDQLPNRQSLEYIINSAIEKYVVRPKMNGGPRILVSGAMWEKNGRKATYYDKKEEKWVTLDTKEQFDAAKNNGEKILLTSNDLKFYTEGPDGKVKGMEIKINNHFKEEMLKWAKENKKEIVSDDELLKYLQTEEGEQLLTGVGFRIPSQGLNSFDVFRIAGFTDDSLGDVVVVPSEITTKSGADFDVDKLNTYLKNFYLDDKGLPKLVKFYDIINENTLEKIWEQNKYIKGEDLIELPEGDVSDFGKEIMNADIATLESMQKETKKELDSLENFIKKNKGKTPYEVNSKQAIHNHYFDTLSDIILHKSNIERLLTPNSTHILEEVDNEMSKATGEDQGKSDDINYSNYLNLAWVNKKRQEMLEAKNATSISASSMTSHAMMQNFPYYLNPEIKIKLPHNKITVTHEGQKVQTTSMSGIKNKKGQFITEVLSQIVNTTVDAVNNPILMRLLPSIDAFKTALVLIRAGVDPMHTFFFLKQPIIKKYIDLKNKNKQESEERRKSAKKLKNWVLTSSDFSGGQPVKDLEMFEMSNDKGTGLKDMITSWSQRYEYLTEKGKENQRKGFSNEKKAMQRAILNEYLEYEKIANQLFEQQQGTYYGNVRKATNNAVWLKKNVFKKGLENPTFIGLHENMQESWHGSLMEAVNTLSDNLSKVLFKTYEPNIQKVTTPAKEYISSLFIKGGMNEKNKLFNRLNSNVLDFVTHNFSKDKNGKPLNEEIARLTMGPNSMANRLIEIQEALEQIRVSDPNADILNNSALNKLIPVISNPKNPKLINIDVKPQGVNEKEDFTSSLEELKEHPGIPLKDEKGNIIKHIDLQQFYEDFVKLGILQAGTAPGRTSWTELIPEEDYEKYTSQGINAIEDNNRAIIQYDNLKVFWRTNFGDDRLVPSFFKNARSVGSKRNRKILKDGSLVVTLPAKNKDGVLNTYSPVVKVKRPIYITVEGKDGKILHRQATKEELAKLRNNNEDFKENLYETEGYQQVLDKMGEPVIVSEVEGSNVVEKYLYKPINLWGDGRNMTEFYLDARPSVLDKNLKVDELTDEEFLDKWEKGDPRTIDGPIDNTNIPKSTEDLASEDDLTPEELAEIEMYNRGQEALTAEEKEFLEKQGIIPEEKDPIEQFEKTGKLDITKENFETNPVLDPSKEDSKPPKCKGEKK